jgi:hypothetical protein
MLSSMSKPTKAAKAAAIGRALVALRNAKLSKRRRSAIAKAAAEARWSEAKGSTGVAPKRVGRSKVPPKRG